MIFTLLLSMPFWFVGLLLAIWPTGGTFPSSLATDIGTLWSIVHAWDWLLPIDTMLACLTVAFSWFGFLFVWRFLHWLLSKIPFVNVH